MEDVRTTEEEHEEDRVAPKCPSELFNFSPDAVLVTDPDEEILELYMSLASTSPETSRSEGGGLGFLDGTKAVLDIELELEPPIPAILSTSSLESPTVTKRHKTRNASATKNSRSREEEVVFISCRIHQDLTALKGRKGDTGEQRTMENQYLAKHILSQHHFPPLTPLLSPERLAKSRILELGAGTGLLAILLSPLCTEYIVSDRLENLKLVQKNLEINNVLPLSSKVAPSNPSSGSSKRTTPAGKTVKPIPPWSLLSSKVRMEEIDWVAVSSACNRAKQPTPIQDSYDVILAVDCIFNENLIKPLVDTLAMYCTKGSNTIVWIVAELRSADVMTLFLETWMNDSDCSWMIVRLGDSDVGRWGMKRGRWVQWVGWRT